MKSQDITGLKYGRWTALNREPNKNSDVRWKFRCDCGTVKVVSKASVTYGKSRSCGCIMKEMLTSSPISMVHGFARTGKVERLHKIWRRMLSRCSNPNNPSFDGYGGRGILVCSEWENDYITFRSWAMANGYSDDLTIDRIDNDKGYYPENCRWATQKQQARNRRRTNWITLNGVTKCLSDWAEEANIHPNIYFRLYTKYGDKFNQGIIEDYLKDVAYKKANPMTRNERRRWNRMQAKQNKVLPMITDVS